jgi:Trk K+ transport system NAD-binding subunit
MLLMFGALLKNIAGPDVLMLGSLAMMLAADAVPIPEGLKGFSNKGLLTVACLFVVAAGISNTGALDYYMGKLLGHPKNAASAQIRLMVPVAFVSAFLNNTPVVAIMIPILQKWSRRVNIPNSQLMIPLSFASILGGTCTLIGTSTNLVVEGMMRERYPDVRPMGLFALSIYGVPVALSGMAYILIASPFLLPGGAGRADAAELQKKNDDSMLEDSLAVGAVVAPKSPVIDQPVATLRGLNGLYLVSVQRGDMLLRAVTPEFMLEEGDILHFTGLVESIGEVCVEHGLLPLTHEVEESLQKQKAAGAVSLSLEPAHADSPRGGHSDGGADSDGFEPEDARAFSSTDTYPPRGREARARRAGDAFGGISARKTRGDYKDVLHAFQMDQDVPGGASPRGDDSDAGGHSTGPESDGGGILSRRGKQVRKRRSSFNMHAGGILRKHKSGSKYGVARGVGPGVFGESDAESEVRRNSSNDTTWSSYDGDGGAGTMAMHEVMSAKDTPASVRRALLERHQILKVRVRTNSSLIGSTAMDVGFREKYKAAIIAVKRGGEDQRAANEGKLASVVFEAGDILMLHCLDKCPLLQWKEPALGAARGSGAGARRRAGRGDAPWAVGRRGRRRCRRDIAAREGAASDSHARVSARVTVAKTQERRRRRGESVDAQGQGRRRAGSDDVSRRDSGARAGERRRAPPSAGVDVRPVDVRPVDAAGRCALDAGRRAGRPRRRHRRRTIARRRGRALRVAAGHARLERARPRPRGSFARGRGGHPRDDRLHVPRARDPRRRRGGQDTRGGGPAGSARAVPDGGAEGGAGEGRSGGAGRRLRAERGRCALVRGGRRRDFLAPAHPRDHRGEPAGGQAEAAQDGPAVSAGGGGDRLAADEPRDPRRALPHVLRRGDHRRAALGRTHPGEDRRHRPARRGRPAAGHGLFVPETVQSRPRVRAGE